MLINMKKHEEKKSTILMIDEVQLLSMTKEEQKKVYDQYEEIVKKDRS